MPKLQLKGAKRADAGVVSERAAEGEGQGEGEGESVAFVNFGCGDRAPETFTLKRTYNVRSACDVYDSAIRARSVCFTIFTFVGVGAAVEHRRHRSKGQKGIV